ncbi:MAG: 16S rRNA processing protein RimM [Bacteroidaceae bacterium]|nr:16S rRNA processing protein RimM [Bacteroidaceae bacterium]
MVHEEDIYSIGYITRTHGVRGEVAFRFTNDVWDRVEADYLFCRIDGLPVPFFLEEWRFRSDDTALLKFEDIDNVDQAQQLIGCEVLFPLALTPSDDNEIELTWPMLRGFKVINNEDQLLGTVDEVYDQTENVLIEVASPNDDSILIPAHEQFIERADHSSRTLYVHVPDELIQLNR